MAPQVHQPPPTKPRDQQQTTTLTRTPIIPTTTQKRNITIAVPYTKESVKNSKECACQGHTSTFQGGQHIHDTISQP